MSRAYLRLARFRHRLTKLVQRLLGIKKTVYVQERVDTYREIWASAAAELGLEFEALGDSFWQVRDDRGAVARLHNYVVSLDDPVTLDMAGDKLLVYRLFEAAGLPIPAYAAARGDAVHELRDFIRERQGPFVVKPARNTASGLGVSTHVRDWRNVLDAAALALLYGDEVLIESHVAGESYRLLYLDAELLCASRRAGVRVTGDGHTRLRELIDRAAPEAGLQARWARDEDVRLTLAQQGLTLDQVPGAGQSVLVRSRAAAIAGREEVRTVYDEDVTDLVCPALIDAGRRACIALGSVFCGVDIITTDPTRPLEASGGTINEINTTPGLHHHYGLGEGAPAEPLAVPVLRYLRDGRARSV